MFRTASRLFIRADRVASGSWRPHRILVSLVLTGLAALAMAGVSQPSEARPRGFGGPVVAIDTIPVGALPVEGRQVLAAIRAGGPFVSRRDGIVFGNREGQLPRQPRGYYAEYTVPTPGARNRGARRIIAGQGTTGDVRTSDEYYYTNDHYQSFRRIVQ